MAFSGYTDPGVYTAPTDSGPPPSPLPPAPTTAPSTDPTDYYTQLLQQDPGYLALKQALSASDQQNQAVENQGIAQALIQYGLIPDFSQAASQLGLSPQALAAIQGAITPQVQALAQQNTANGLSTEAQLQQQEQQAMLGLRNNLAARGALSSGDDAYRTGLQEHAYALAQNKALQSLLGALGGYQQNYLTAHQAGQQQLAQAIPGIITNLMNEYPNGPSTSLGGNTYPGSFQVAPPPTTGGGAGGGSTALPVPTVGSGYHPGVSNL